MKKICIIFLFHKSARRGTKGEARMDKYECTLCGYIYDPATGDAETNIPAGTRFEDLPDDWVCPSCGAPKYEFVRLAE